MPGWLAWDSAAAVAAVETIFGAKAGPTSARRLSPAEVKVASLFLAELLKGVAPALGVTPTDFALVVERQARIGLRRHVVLRAVSPEKAA